MAECQRVVENAKWFRILFNVLRLGKRNAETQRTQRFAKAEKLAKESDGFSVRFFAFFAALRWSEVEFSVDPGSGGL
jgi:hypothetical protein